jgi:hypothetical protein
MRRKMLNNFSKKLGKKPSSESSSEQNQNLRNLPLKPIPEQVPHFLFKFRKCELAKPSSSLALLGFIQVQKVVKNNPKKFKFRNTRNLLQARLHDLISSLWCVYPPYTMGVRIPP